MRPRFSFERRPTLLFALMLAVTFLILATTPAANATAIVTSQITVESFSIIPASGSITFSSPPNAQVSARASNTIASSFNEQTGHSVSTNARVTWAAASSFADLTSGTASALATINTPDHTGSPFSDAFAALYPFNLFSIAGTSGPVSVELNATVPYAQSLWTTDGRGATSFLYFSAWITDPSIPISNFVGFITGSSSLEVSPFSNDFLNKSDTFNLSDSVMLESGHEYGLVARGLVVSGLAVPEPASLSLLFAGILPPVIFRRLCR